MSTDILVVDDEAAIADLVEICLKNEATPSTSFIPERRPSPVWRAPTWTWPFWT